MSSYKDNLCDTSLFTRFVDAIDFQAGGPAKNQPFIKYFDETEKIEKITYDEFRYSVYSAAQYFKDELTEIINQHKANESHINIGYLSENDKNCVINHFGVMYLNLTPVLLSPKNSVSAMVHLLNEAGANALVYDESCEHKATLCKQSIPGLKLIKKQMHCKSLIAIKDPPEKVLESQGLEHVALMVHSSGSTSSPKLVKISNRYILATIKRSRLEPGEKYYLTSDMFLLAPVFHIFGQSMVWCALYGGTTLVFSPYSMSSKKILNQINESESKSVVLLPLQILQITNYCLNNPENIGWDQLYNIAAFAFSGATLPENLIKIILQKGLRIFNIYGSSETGKVGSCLLDSKSSNFNELTICPGLSYDLVHEVGETYQILINKLDDGLSTDLCEIDKQGYLMGDLCKIIKFDHKTKDLKFEYAGRTSDILVHISGEKTNPISMEENIQKSKFIEKCVILGDGRLNNCILIQLKENLVEEYSLKYILDDIHEFIALANNEAPSHSRVDKDLVYFLPINSKKLLPTTTKGNVIRLKAETDFKDEIYQLYESYGDL